MMTLETKLFRDEGRMKIAARILKELLYESEGVINTELQKYIIKTYGVKKKEYKYTVRILKEKGFLVNITVLKDMRSIKRKINYDKKESIEKIIDIYFNSPLP